MIEIYNYPPPTAEENEPRIIPILTASTSTRVPSTRGRVFSPYGIAPCLNACGGGNIEPRVLLED